MRTTIFTFPKYLLASHSLLRVRLTYRPFLRLSRFALIPIIIGLLASGCSAFSVLPPPQPTPFSTREIQVTPIATSSSTSTPFGVTGPRPAVTIVLTRQFEGFMGKLAEKNGCLTLGGRALAWPPGYRVTRTDDVLRFADVHAGKPNRVWEFRLGEELAITVWAGLSTSDWASLQTQPGCPEPFVIFLEGPRSHLVNP